MRIKAKLGMRVLTVLGRRRVPVRSAGCCWLERCDGLSCPKLACSAALNRHSSPRTPCAGYAGSQKRDLSRTIRWKRFPFIVRVAHTSSSPLRWNPQLRSTKAPAGPLVYGASSPPNGLRLGGLLDRRRCPSRLVEGSRAPGAGSARQSARLAWSSSPARIRQPQKPAHNEDDDADKDAQTSDKPDTQPTQPQHNWNSRRVPRPTKLLRMPLQKVNVAPRISVLVVHANSRSASLAQSQNSQWNSEQYFLRQRFFCSGTFRNYVSEDDVK
ncbi:hypothetical protein MTO96_015104 [Rhipicephalus appendiculatus]